MTDYDNFNIDTRARIEETAKDVKEIDRKLIMLSDQLRSDHVELKKTKRDVRAQGAAILILIIVLVATNPVALAQILHAIKVLLL